MRGRRTCDTINGCGKSYRYDLTACPHCGAPEWVSAVAPYNPKHWVYDLESYPNVFLAAFKHPLTGTRARFEASPWRNNLPDLFQFLGALRGAGCSMIGFNNVGYDYPMIHHFLTTYHTGIDARHMYFKNESIINTPWDDRFSTRVKSWEVVIPQIDLYLIHHFDNESKRTSLKELEFNMRLDNVDDLPFTPGTELTEPQCRELVRYNDWDVDATEMFYDESLELIRFRGELSERYGRDFTNHNDTKIGSDYFSMELARQVPGYGFGQTHRSQIVLADAILPYVNFEQPEFQRVLGWLKNQVLTETKGVFTDLTATVAGFDYVFGVGGIHGSVESQTVRSDDDAVIYDWDVASYYPTLAIANRLHPAHLGEQFCDIYQDVFNQRKQYPKGSAENAMLKLALNGVYGKSNSVYSEFYDPLYTMSITINGQLLLCMLAEQLIKIPGLTVIQINTDGITVKCPRTHVDHMKAVCQWWEKFTCLALESAIYDSMFIRDVNNYLAVYQGGKLKRKGAYCYGSDLGWHQNQSAQVVAMAAEAALVRGVPVEKFVADHKNIHDFMLRAKVGRKDRLVIRFGTVEVPQQRITRYYVSKSGGSMIKVSPPIQGATVGQWKRSNGISEAYYRSVLAELTAATGEPLDTTGKPWDARINTKNRSTYNQRETAIERGYLVSECNRIDTFHWDDLHRGWYINEARKLVEVMK